LLYALAAVAAYAFHPQMAPRGTMTMIASLFFLSGVQLAFIGILGEYVTSIHAQVRRGPMVVVRESINVEPNLSDRLSSPDPLPQRPPHLPVRSEFS
jgi:hypothetical protein